MVFSDLFERYVQDCPACVMHRALMENIFAPAKVDAIFHQAAETQYERELLFSTLVDVVSLVVCRTSKSVHAACVRERDRIPVSIRALYDKLNRVEIGTSRALVQHTASEVSELIDHCKGRPAMSSSSPGTAASSASSMCGCGAGRMAAGGGSTGSSRRTVPIASRNRRLSSSLIGAGARRFMPPC